MAKRKKKLWYQYCLEDVFGKEWKTHPVLREEQVSMTDLYDGSVLGVEEEEVRFRRDVYRKSCRICVRTIVAGEQVECDIYPVWGKHDVPRGIKSRESRATQQNLNRKNSQKTMLRYLHANFKAGDLIMTLTYEDYYYPTKERAQKDIRNFLTAIRRERKKAGMEPLKYIYVIEYVSDPENTNKVRVHHHLIINSMDRDLAESKWKKGRVNARYADTDRDFVLEGFGRYITKTVFSRGEHAWQKSRNLKKPIIHESVTKLTRKKMYEMVRSGDDIGKIMEQMYRGRFRYLDSKIYCSDYVGGFYIYGRLRKKDGVCIVEDNNEQTEPDQRSGRMNRSGMTTQENRQKTPSPVAGDAAGEELHPVQPEDSRDTGREDKQSDPDRTTEAGHAERIHTDIYINASWHGDLDIPTKPARGEYAVTNEVEMNGTVHSGHVYGAWENIERERLYLRALLDALNRYTMACDITVHCDSTAIWSKINNGTYMNYSENEMSSVRNADLIRLLQKRLGFHAVSVELEAENKYTHAGMELLKTKIKQGKVIRKEE